MQIYHAVIYRMHKLHTQLCMMQIYRNVIFTTQIYLIQIYHMQI